ncbi:FAD-dependent oxidoreductase [Streptomyces sp. NPDC004111]|uniref:FAD-dependent oxidoreductase n=1 Tax=Streptomyces sp. NPDC004111 TaxID=3364690 RepID=UPI00367C2797
MKAVIIGAGIGGLALAVTLQRRNVECLIHERRPGITSEGSGLVLHPNGLAALELIDPELRREVTTVGYSLPDDTPTYILSSNGNVIRERIPTPSERPVTIRRADLHKLLYARSGQAQVQLGSNFLGYTETNSSLRAHVAREKSSRCNESSCRTRSPGDPEVQDVEADVLVGADGLHSKVRCQLLDDGSPRPMGLTSIKSIVRLDHDDPRLRGGFVLFGRGYQAFCSPLGPDVLYWDVTLRSAHRALRERRNLRRSLLARSWGWPPYVRDMIAATRPDDMFVTVLRDRPDSPRWSRGAVTLVGDAAHPMSPFLGQGTNQALLDAVVLAEAIDTHGRDLTKAFYDYEEARRDIAYQAMRDSRQIGFQGQTRNPYVRWLRDRSVRASPQAVTPK